MAVAPSRRPRYAPWLQKALRIKDETERFWTQESNARQPRASDAAPAKAPAVRPTSATIWAAIEADDVAAATQVLDAMPTLVFQRQEAPGCSSGGSVTVLHEAAFHGSVHIVELVLSLVETQFPGESLRLLVNASDTISSQTTPLIAACRGIKGNARDRLKIVQLLIHAGADVEHQDAHGDNALHWCARTSNNVVLRWLLTATDAGATAVFAENYKRDKPLDVAKRQVATATSQHFAAQNAYSSLRSVDRKCNVPLKIQVIKRQTMSLEHERVATREAQWATAHATAQDAVESVERMWTEALARAEENRRDAEKMHADHAAETARVDAIQWLESKDGKNYVKKQLGIATEELKIEILRGTISKSKDMKKAATHRVSETYATQQADAARKSAIEKWRTKRPPIPSTLDKLEQLLERL